MKSVLFFGSLSLAVLLQNSCCTPHLNTSGKLSEVGKSYTGFANEIPEKIYLKNGIYYAEVKQQNFSYSAPVINHAFCPNVGESHYSPTQAAETEIQLFYFPLVATQASLPMNKDTYILQLKAHKNTLIAERDFDKTGSRSIPVKNVITEKRHTIAKATLNNDPVITDTTTTTTNQLLKPLVALDTVAVDLPLTVAGGVPLVIGSGLYKGGQWVGSLFSDTASTEKEDSTDEAKSATVIDAESPVEEITPAIPSVVPAVPAQQTAPVPQA